MYKEGWERTPQGCFERFKSLVDDHCWSDGARGDVHRHWGDPYRKDIFEVFRHAKTAGWMENHKAPDSLNSNRLRERMFDSWRVEGKPEAVEGDGVTDPGAALACTAVDILDDILRRWDEWEYAWDAAMEVSVARRT